MLKIALEVTSFCLGATFGIIIAAAIINKIWGLKD